MSGAQGVSVCLVAGEGFDVVSQLLRFQVLTGHNLSDTPPHTPG